MLSDEEMSKNCGVVETILIDYELNIKLKAMQETERKMIDKFKNHLAQMLTKKTNGFDLTIDIPTVNKIGNYVIDILEKEFNEKWFK